MASRWSLQGRSKRKVAEYTSVSSVNVNSEFSDKYDDIISTGSPSQSSKRLNLRQIADTREANGSSESDSQTESNDTIDNRMGERDDGLEQEKSTSDERDDELEEKNNGEKESTTQDLLCHGAVSHNISHAALKDLLCVLRERHDSNLPAEPRPSCTAPASIAHQIDQICGGEYYHFVLKNALHQFLNLASEAVISNLPSIFLLKS